MRKVITYGTFDYFHYGHYNLIKRAKQLGDYIVVGVSSDKMCKEKGKAPILDENERMEIISNLKFVDEVILENNLSQKVLDVEKYGIDVFVLGSDYREIFPKMPEFKQLKDLGCKIVFLERTPDISTSQIKTTLLEQIKMDQNPNSLRSFTKE